MIGGGDLDNELINKSLCDAKMRIIEVKLDSIQKDTDNIGKELEKLVSVCEAIPDHEKRLITIEKWKDNLSLNKIIISVAATVTALGIIYKAIMTLIQRG